MEMDVPDGAPETNPAPRLNVILGCSGSVACIKVPEIALLFKQRFPQCKLTIIPTYRGKHFIPEDFDGFSDHGLTKTDAKRYEYENNIEIMDPGTVISLGQVRELALSIDAFVIAPLGANLMARLAGEYESTEDEANRCSILEKIVAEFLRHGREVPFLVAPAMNPMMWNSRITKRQLESLRHKYGKNFHILPTVSKTVMCGETGFGAMASPLSIIRELERAMLHQLIQAEHTDDLPSFPTTLLQKLVRRPAGPTPKENDFRFELIGSSIDCSEFLQACFGNDLHAVGYRKSVTFLTQVLSVTHASSIAATGLHVLANLSGQHTDGSQEVLRDFVADVGHFVEGELKVKKIVKTSSVDQNPGGDGAKDGLELESLTKFTDELEWKCWRTRGDPILHIWLRQWASVLLLINPEISVLKKIAYGICDDLLTCVVRAWDFRKGAVILFSREHLSVSGDNQELWTLLAELGFAICSRKGVST